MRNEHAVFCANCGLEIEGCVGLHGEWMHSRTRSELCQGPKRFTFAVPEDPFGNQARVHGARRDRVAS